MGLYFSLVRTRIGLIIRAALTHPKMVSALGHDIPKIYMWTFGVGCALAGLAGVLGGNVLGTDPGMAIQLGPIIFVVIVIGGLCSLGGALIASLFIGLLNNLAISYDLSLYPIFAAMGISRDVEGILSDLVNLTTGGIAPLVPYLLLVAILIFRPRGLWGMRDV